MTIYLNATFEYANSFITQQLYSVHSGESNCPVDHSHVGYLSSGNGGLLSILDGLRCRDLALAAPLRSSHGYHIMRWPPILTCLLYWIPISSIYGSVDLPYLSAIATQWPLVPHPSLRRACATICAPSVRAWCRCRLVASVPPGGSTPRRPCRSTWIDRRCVRATSPAPQRRCNTCRPLPTCAPALAGSLASSRRCVA